MVPVQQLPDSPKGNGLEIFLSLLGAVVLMAITRRWSSSQW
jgi:hypothetical protein